ncbi:MAG: 50S ribosomal protein L29 [Clostridia bacterium]|nr:50S ribosomal protein L29 [Clostridia bacterium]MDD4376267.1 50S ribosomal protein L29 [Clostridia bacterium]
MNKNMEKYNKMKIEELQNELKELKKELFKLRFGLAMNGLDNPNKIKETKKNIARVNTAMTILEMGSKE